jgi:hypothetical protein
MSPPNIYVLRCECQTKEETQWKIEQKVAVHSWASDEKVVMPH